MAGGGGWMDSWLAGWKKQDGCRDRDRDRGGGKLVRHDRRSGEQIGRGD